MDAERGVILEEIAMHDDDPADKVHEAFAAQLFGDTPLGRPILGTVDSINAITRDQIAEHYRGRYTPDHLVVAAAGNLDHDEVVELVRRGVRRRCSATRRRGRRLPPRLAGRRAGAAPAILARGVRLVSRGDRAGQPGPRLRRAWPGPTTAGSRSACSTPRSAAACRPGCSRRSGRSAGWPTRSTASPRSTPTPACSASTRAACRPRPTRCWRSAGTRSPRWSPAG